MEEKNRLRDRKTKGKLEKKYIRYREGAEMYSMSQSSFERLAKDAGAVLKIGKMSLVEVKTFDKYLETFKVET